MTAGWRDRLDERAELRGAAAGVVAGLGVCLSVRRLAPVSFPPTAVGLYDVPFLLLSIALLYAGYWLLRSDFDHRRVGRVALWSLAGFAALLAVGVWVSAGRSVGLQRSLALVVDVGTVGASSGLLAGLCGERRRSLDGESAAAVERAEERFAFFNRLLRHHLLNGVAVVRGHAELLDEEGPCPETVEIIRQRSDEIVHLVRNVDALSRTFTGDLPVYDVDPSPPLRAAIESARADGATVDVSEIPDDGRRVLANDRLQVVFETALDAAASAAEDRRVAVEAARRDGAFAARFGFDGRFADDRGRSLEAGEHGDDALGLFIAERLVEYFGGSLELVEAGPRSVLTVRLPLVD